MPANATPRAVRNIVRSARPQKKLNILTFPTHERYEQNLARTGHNFYSLSFGKKWDTDYAKIPDNYYMIDAIPDYIDFDLILAHTDCERLATAYQHLSGSRIGSPNKTYIPILRHNHVLPDVRYDIQQQKQASVNPIVDVYSFISDYSRGEWGFSQNNSVVIEHGVDTDFWTDGNEERDNVCLSVVNDWPNRDWCCGFNLWRQTSNGLPVRVYGKSPGFSVVADSTEHLRTIYQKSKIFYNTSLHSPVPSVLLEAMACGCAIVSTANCMIPEIIQHGQNGLISNNPEELRKYLEMLLHNDTVASKLGEEARKTIVEKYNLDNFVSNWNNLFNSIINQYRNQ